MKKTPRPFMLFLLTIFLFGCAGLPAQPTGPPATSPTTAPATPTTPVAPTETTPAPPENTPATTPTEASIPPAMSDTGPWLVIITPDGLWIVNADGTGLTRLTDRRVAGPQDITAMPSPGGNYFAYLTSREIYKDLTLNIHLIPRGLAQTIPLVAPEFQPAADALPGDPALEAVRALVEVTSLAWSPDGTQLAFTAVLDGPTSDLYVFSVEDFYFEPDTTPYTRLTDGPSQGIKPSWSPDNRTIVHAGVSTLGTGAGYGLEGVWAAQADDSEVETLYIPENSGDERIVGWVDEKTFLTATWSPVCGTERLRTFDLETKTTTPVWTAPFNGVAFDPDRGGLLISLDQFTADCSDSGQAGLFYLPSPGGSPITIVEEEAFLPVWDAQAGLFFARTTARVLAIQPDGTLISLQAPEPILPLGAANGNLAWASSISGVWITNWQTNPGEAPRNIHPDPAFVPAWSPDGQHLFFFSEAGFYAAHAPDFAPELLAEGMISGGAFWLSGAEE